MTIGWVPKRIPGWAGVYSWESQANLYAPVGEPGIGYERHYADGFDRGPEAPVDCLLMRDVTGVLVGILNHYPESDPGGIEEAGNVNVWVRPDRQRRGVGRSLIREAASRWTIDPVLQRYSDEGLALLHALERDGEL